MFSASLALIASLLWGSSDFAAGLMTRRTTLWAVVLLTQTGGFTAVGILVLLQRHPFPSTAGVIIGMLTGLSGICAIVSFYKALSIGMMSLVAPLSSTGIVVPIAVGLGRGDRPSVAQALGMTLALAGIALASVEPTERAAAGPPTSGYVAAADEGQVPHPPVGDDPPPDPHEKPLLVADERPAHEIPAAESAPELSAALARPPSRLRSAVRKRTSVLLALVAALMIGLSYVGLAEGATYDSYWTVFLMRATTLPMVLAAALVVRPRLGLSLAAVPIVIAVGIADVVANTLYAIASTGVLLAVVGVLGYLFPVVTVVLARVFLQERLTRLQQAGALAALAGALLIVAS